MGGYSPKQCDLFSKCEKSTVGEKYFKGNHEIWEKKTSNQTFQIE